MEHYDLFLDSDPDESDIEDENELRQLDAALEEANIIVCDMPTEEPSTSSQLTNQASSPTAQPDQVSDEEDDEVARIDAAISLNKQYEEKMRRLETILAVRLRECRAKLNEIQNCSALPAKQEVFRYINCGRPYFRDHKNCPAPDNPDTIMAKSQMYDFSLVTSVPGWTVRDKNKFTEAMIQMSLDIKRQRIKEKLLDLQGLPKTKKVQKDIAKLQKERDSLNAKMPFVQLALPLDEEYDWELIANKLNRRHTACEYRSLWKLYFHPSINKSNWKTKEHNTLQSLVSAHNYQHWDEIAKVMNNGRTGYQCFVYYRSNMTNNCIGKKWTPDEVTYLRRLIEFFKEDCYIPWGKIAAAMENRTKIQIYNKYMRLLEQRKGRFLPEEDAVILNCVESFGKNFRQITEYLSHRSMIQIRSRYQVLSKMRVSTVWSVEDDKKLLQIMTNQDSSNTTFSNATKFFPGRNRVNIRSRYVTLLKWMKRHPNSGIEHAPRRGARRLNHGQATDNLTKAIEDLKVILNKEVAVKKDRKKISVGSNETDIEDSVIVVLVNEQVKEQEIKKNEHEGTLVLPNDMVVLYKDLDLTNLRKCLIFLSSHINKELFAQSHYSKEYPDLGNTSQNVSLIKVKSYSRKNNVKTIAYNGTPDVWGNTTLSPRNYVLPPHYSTVTGCKAIMSYVSSFCVYTNSVNLHILVKRNALIKECMDLLLERFYTLFLWPMILSNEGPTDFYNSKLCKRDSFYVRPPTLPQSPEVTIKLSSHKKLKNPDIAEQIDLNEDEIQKELINLQRDHNEQNDHVNDNIKSVMK